MLFWSPEKLLIPLFCPLGTRACVVPIAQKVQFSLFFILSFLLVLFLWKSMADYLFRSALRSRSSRFSFWPSFFFILFLKWAESHSANLKVLCYYSLFYTSSFWFPEVPPTCAMRSHSRFSSFLAGSFGTWEGCAHPLFHVFFWLFPLSNLNPFLTVLHASGILSLLAVSEDPDSAFFLL